MCRRIDRGVQEHPIDLGAPKTALLDELIQRIVYFHVQSVGKIAGKETLTRTVDEGFDSCQQGAVAGKPDCLMRPEASIIEVSDLVESVIAAPMGIAGQVVQRFQLPEDRQVRIRVQSALQLRKGRDFMTTQILAERLGIKADWPHNVRIPSERRDVSEL